MNPLIRVNLECGTDQNLSAGREPCQNGWYDWVGRRWCIGENVLDIGAGMCEGMKILENLGAQSVFGQDIDNRLKQINPNIIIKDVSQIESKSFDVITCFDVIEHVIEDEIFFKELTRIARKRICITTPNFSRSKAQNHCHCREYTIPQFVNSFFPDELWVASPDGKIHHNLLLLKIKDGYTDITRKETIYKRIPDDLNFCHSTVDGQEWPHMCGIFNIY
jgi:hypothetical protein